MNPIFFLLDLVLGFYFWVVIISVVLSWLIAFNILNARNEIAALIVRVFYGLTEPVFSVIRRYVPPIAGLDLSPLIVLFFIMFARYTLRWLTATYGI